MHGCCDDNSRLGLLENSSVCLMRVNSYISLVLNKSLKRFVELIETFIWFLKRYFVENASRICTEGYVPTTQDIVHSRAITCGIVEEHFEAKGSFFTVIDVGGQRSERMKW